MEFFASQHKQKFDYWLFMVNTKCFVPKKIEISKAIYLMTMTVGTVGKRQCTIRCHQKS